MNIITGQQALKEYKECKEYKRFLGDSCVCDQPIFEPVMVETEKEINGADVPTLEFFCSEQCAHEWLDSVESKKQTA